MMSPNQLNRDLIACALLDFQHAKTQSVKPHRNARFLAIEYLLFGPSLHLKMIIGSYIRYIFITMP